jgi:hypothetical protein
MTTAIRKYPRTRHLEGSRLQPGDEDLEALAFDQLRGRHLVVEEKVDGANAAVSFDEDGSLWLQSRGHYLRGGAREKHFALLKTWASGLQSPLRDRLGPRHVMFGEWVYAKHTVYYDELPHYFLEFDVLDREHGVFLSTERRRRLLAGLPIASVPVLSEGSFDRLEDLVRWVGPSTLKGKRWRERLRDVARGVPWTAWSVRRTCRTPWKGCTSRWRRMAVWWSEPSSSVRRFSRWYSTRKATG